MSGSYAWRCIFCGTPVAHMQAAHLRCISRVPGWQIDRARAGPGLVVRQLAKRPVLAISEAYGSGLPWYSTVPAGSVNAP